MHCIFGFTKLKIPLLRGATSGGGVFLETTTNSQFPFLKDFITPF
jgi:hypothetical protein